MIGDAFRTAKAIMNTPERIVTRSPRARFYCADCRKLYHAMGLPKNTPVCKCAVYRSADTLDAAKQLPRTPARGVCERH